MSLLTTSLSSVGTTNPNNSTKPDGTGEEVSGSNEDVEEPAIAAVEVSVVEVTETEQVAAVAAAPTLAITRLESGPRSGARPSAARA